MNRSQRILIAIGVAAMAAMAAPYVTRSLVDSRATSGKSQVIAADSAVPQKDLVLCLIRAGGSLNLSVASNDIYTDPASGLAVQVLDQGSRRRLNAWVPQGKALTPAQAAQIETCRKG